MLLEAKYVRDRVAAACGQSIPKQWRRGIEYRAMRSRDDSELMDFMRLIVKMPKHIEGGIKVDMSDRDICEMAEDCAKRCEEFTRLYRTVELMRSACDRLAVAKGAKPLDEKMLDSGALARYLDSARWRQWLRTAYAKLAEGVAINLGLVHAKNDLYVTGSSLDRRIQQNARNAKTLADTYLENELGQVFSIAELAALSTSNKSIKRSELMVRLAGFDQLAKMMGHAGEFITITCPSRMHPIHRQSGEFNKNYDGTTPKAANDYLCKLWQKIRAVWAKAGVSVYGFRMAEPHHDACPHWHMVLFFGPQHRSAVRRTILKYALKDSGAERGAWKNRVKCKPIDFKKGGAAAYLAKYIAKNIDGYKVGNDLLGQDALTTSQRVEAWAATWRIRQFQQIGGAPVGVWRELRRVKELPSDAPQSIKQAYEAVNYARINKEKNEVATAVMAKDAWLSYQLANGGAVCAKKDRPIQMHKVYRSQLGKYAEPLGWKNAGVTAWGNRAVAEGEYGYPMMPHKHIIEGRRYEWKPAAKRVLAETAQPLSTWIHVSNCNQFTEQTCINELENMQKMPRDWRYSKYDDYEGAYFDDAGGEIVY